MNNALSLMTHPTIINSPAGRINMETICNDGIANINETEYWNLSGKDLAVILEPGLIYLPRNILKPRVSDGRVWFLPEPVPGTIIVVSEEIARLCPGRSDLRFAGPEITLGDITANDGLLAA